MITKLTLYAYRYLSTNLAHTDNVCSATAGKPVPILELPFLTLSGLICWPSNHLLKKFWGLQETKLMEEKLTEDLACVEGFEVDL